MKTERAIELLHRLQDEQFDGIHGDERREALEMAVRALVSQQTVNDSQGLVNDCISRQAVMKEFSDFVRKSNNSDFAQTPTWNDAVSLVGSMPSAQPETHDKRTETHACDLINRQQAIDAVKDLPNCRNGFSDTYDKACIIGVLEDLSTALPQWIPCSERLPEANGRYFVTRGLNACGAMWNRVYIINYSDLMGLKSERIWWGGNVGKSDFERFDDVIAWMPLPEPYGGESE